MSLSPSGPISPTQRDLGEVEIARYVRDAFGPGVEAVAMAPLSGGGFASVTRIDLSDGRSVVLKVGPSAGTGILAYEDGVVGAEARYLQLVDRHLPGAPFPRLLHHGVDASPGGSEWLITEFLPGVALTAVEQEADQNAVRADLGATVARLHTITGAHYGYDGCRASGRTWHEAYAAIIESLLDDAVRWNVRLVAPPERVRAAVARGADVLDEVDRPALLHFDLWDGNALCAADADGRWGLAGLVDGERFLFGDPLVDFVSPALFRRIEQEPEHPFVLGYASVAGRPVTFTARECRRLELYRLHLYLLMTVEMPSRGMTRGNQPWRFDRLETLLRDCLDVIESWDA
ncbi:aminoglycoside phosphotransferase family protein [Actinospica sp.]|uniref:phosphotransferase family protein n=1 Tax=Actinospica sp. TaxID=1872142 RepID=UPI002CDD30FE|nr:aminoglycoside phosphotransferase family protein [Actinospica sp.]HWG24669.1 aminoglycoside phosphotransferase family protein [Actinospica sp.]